MMPSLFGSKFCFQIAHFLGCFFDESFEILRRSGQSPQQLAVVGGFEFGIPDMDRLGEIIGYKRALGCRKKLGPL